MVEEHFKAAAETGAAAAANKATYYGGAAAAAGGWVLDSNTIALCGLTLGLIGYLTNLFFKVRDDKRKQEAHRLEMEHIRDKINSNREQGT